jgi:arabinoxylan arabinofuranohydrolase
LASRYRIRAPGPSIIEFGGRSYFIYHDGSILPKDGEPGGGDFRRPVCIDPLYYNEDDILERVIMTRAGIRQPASVSG